MTPELETSRLFLRPLELADAEQIQSIFPHWEIVRFLAGRVPWPYPPDGAYSYIRDLALPAIVRGDEWHWTLRLKPQPAQVIGSIGLMKGEKQNRGFWMGLPWQRRGLMSEACEAVSEFWFNTLQFPVLRAPKAIGNTGSRRISEKSGMRLAWTEEHDFVCGRMMAEIWEITAEEWRARRSE